MTTADEESCILEDSRISTKRPYPPHKNKSTARLRHGKDWSNIDDILEKKRVQNRNAQRKYRLSVKRKIDELEKRVAAQAALLAEVGEQETISALVQSPQHKATCKENFPKCQALTRRTQVLPSSTLSPLESDSIDGNNQISRAQKDPDHTGSIDARIMRLIRFTQSIGFQDLDQVIITYYTEQFEADSVCARWQRLSRRRRLPELLGKLRSARNSWTSSESEPFSHALMKSAEDILLCEVRKFLDEWDLTEFHQPLEMEEVDWSCLYSEFQTELPKLCSMMSKLLYQNQNGSTHQSRLTRLLISILYQG